MAKQLMIYERAVPVSADKHRDWSVRMGADYGFARAINSVPLVAAEFMAAAVHYPIVFAGEGDAIMPAIILGMADGQNGSVLADGTWDGGYVPAFLRRYPFVFARSDAGDSFTLCVDEEFEGFNNEGRGERMFDSDGTRTQFLNNMLRFLQEYQSQFTITQRFTKRLKDLNLLESAQASFTTNGRTSQLAGFQTVNRQKLKELPAETLKEMALTDELELCYLHLHSLNNMTPMAQRIAAAEQGRDAA